MPAQKKDPRPDGKPKRKYVRRKKGPTKKELERMAKTARLLAQGKRPGQHTAPRKPRSEPRQLMRWGDGDFDKQLLMATARALGATEHKHYWDLVGAYFGPGVTGNAVLQHIVKMTDRAAGEGKWFPELEELSGRVNPNGNWTLMVASGFGRRSNRAAKFVPSAGPPLKTHDGQAVMLNPDPDGDRLLFLDPADPRLYGPENAHVQMMHAEHDGSVDGAGADDTPSLSHSASHINFNSHLTPGEQGLDTTLQYPLQGMYLGSPSGGRAQSNGLGAPFQQQEVDFNNNAGSAAVFADVSDAASDAATVISAGRIRSRLDEGLELEDFEILSDPATQDLIANGDPSHPNPIFNGTFDFDAAAGQNGFSDPVSFKREFRRQAILGLAAKRRMESQQMAMDMGMPTFSTPVQGNHGEQQQQLPTPNTSGFDMNNSLNHNVFPSSTPAAIDSNFGWPNNTYGMANPPPVTNTYGTLNPTPTTNSYGMQHPAPATGSYGYGMQNPAAASNSYSYGMHTPGLASTAYGMIPAGAPGSGFGDDFRRTNHVESWVANTAGYPPHVPDHQQRGSVAPMVNDNNNVNNSDYSNFNFDVGLNFHDNKTGFFNKSL